jgi:hypothetical protein
MRLPQLSDALLEHVHGGAAQALPTSSSAEGTMNENPLYHSAGDSVNPLFDAM